MVINLYFLLENIITDRLILLYMEINTLLPTFYRDSENRYCLFCFRITFFFFCFREVTWLKLFSVFFFTFLGSLMLTSIVLFLLQVIKQRRQLKTGMQQNFTKILFREKPISKCSTEKANKQINTCSLYLLFLDLNLGWWGEFRKSYLILKFCFFKMVTIG